MIWKRIFASKRRMPAARNMGTGHLVPTIREPEASWWQAAGQSPAVTVAVLRDQEVRGDTEPVTSRLAALAKQDELLVMLGASDSGPAYRGIVAELREQLARHRVVEFRVRLAADGFRDGALVAERLLADGGLPVVVAPEAQLHGAAAEISSYLRADRVVRVLRTATGADLHQVWSRPEPVLN